MQGNLCILPKDLALEFAAFCQRNPKPCPLIGMGAPGDPTLPDLGDIDIRTDVPRYRVFKDGKLIDEPTDIRKYWSDDLVTFVIGCSFSFEQPLLEAGIRLQHVEAEHARCRCTAPASIACRPAASSGKMVVSMRPFKPADAIRAMQITSRFPGRARRAGTHRPARGDRHRATSRAPISAMRRDRAGRAAVVLGLRSDAAGRHRGGTAVDLHHPQAGLDADHRQEERGAGRALSELVASAIESSQALQRAMEHARQGRLAEARQLCEGVLVTEPANSGALSCLGEVLLAMRRPEEALACFERLVQAQPNGVEALCNRGIALLVLGRHEPALASLDRRHADGTGRCRRAVPPRHLPDGPAALAGGGR